MRNQYWIFLLIAITIFSLYAEKIAIIGCGYVGLTTAAMLASDGHTVICMDIDRVKIDALHHKKLPIYEPHLYELLFESDFAKNIFFVHTICDAVDAELLYLCLPTPLDNNNNCDYSLLEVVVKEILENIHTDDSKIICVKSTIVPGTTRKLAALIPYEKKQSIHIVYNPEFMREGSAFHDQCFINPIVLAGEPAILEKLERLYRPLHDQRIRFIKTNYETAELIKYGWNSFSAIRIAYINELAMLCRNLNADIYAVIDGIAQSEQLLQTGALKPGPGYGGSCLPKDTVAFANYMQQYGFDSCMVCQAITSNKNHQEKLIQDIISMLPEKTEKPCTVAIFGLSFKASTNDIRNSPAIAVIQALLSHNAIIKAYDAWAMPEMQKLFPSIQYYDSPYNAARNADLIVILTECETIKSLDFEKLSLICNRKVMIDTRNLYHPKILRKYGFIYLNMGRV